MSTAAICHPRPLTIDGPLHPPDAQQDEEADGVPGALGPVATVDATIGATDRMITAASNTWQRRRVSVPGVVPNVPSQRPPPAASHPPEVLGAAPPSTLLHAVPLSGWACGHTEPLTSVGLKAAPSSWAAGAQSPPPASIRREAGWEGGAQPLWFSRDLPPAAPAWP